MPHLNRKWLLFSIKKLKQKKKKRGQGAFCKTAVVLPCSDRATLAPCRAAPCRCRGPPCRVWIRSRRALCSLSPSPCCSHHHATTGRRGHGCRPRSGDLMVQPAAPLCFSLPSSYCSPCPCSISPRNDGLEIDMPQLPRMTS